MRKSTRMSGAVNTWVATFVCLMCAAIGIVGAIALRPTRDVPLEYYEMKVALRDNERTVADREAEIGRVEKQLDAEKDRYAKLEAAKAAVQPAIDGRDDRIRELTRVVADKDAAAAILAAELKAAQEAKENTTAALQAVVNLKGGGVTTVPQLISQADLDSLHARVDNLQTLLDRERREHDATRTQLKAAQNTPRAIQVSNSPRNIWDVFAGQNGCCAGPRALSSFVELARQGKYRDACCHLASALEEIDPCWNGQTFRLEFQFN